MAAQELTIDPEFRDLLPALDTFEREFLRASLKRDGLREPIEVWANHDDTLIDGHNRYELCREEGIAIKTRAVRLEDRGAVIEYICCKQLARRNLSEEKKSYVRGKIYEQRKMRHGGDRKSDDEKSRGNSCPLISTADEVAAEQGVSARTVKNDAAFAAAVDALADVAPDAKASILGGGVKASRSAIVQAAKLPKQEREAAAKAILNGEQPAKAPPKEKPFDFAACAAALEGALDAHLARWPETKRPEFADVLRQYARELTRQRPVTRT